MSSSPHQRRSARPLVVGFIVLAVLIAAAGYWAWRVQAQSVKTQAEHTLRAVGELKANQISAWLKERRGNAEMIRANPLISIAATDVLAGPSATAGTDLQAVLDAFRRTYGYTEVVMTSPRGAALLHSPRAAPAPLGGQARALLAKATATGRVQTSDLFLDAAGRPRIDFVAPVPSTKRGAPAIAAVTLRADPVDYLYPLIQTWPLPSRSGETLLVERRGKQVLYLNELRFRQNTALKLAAPANKPSLPAAMALRGRRGVVQGIDYRGVPVLAAVQPVPGAPWFIVAKEDTNEVLGSTRTRGWLTAGIALVLVALAGLGTLLLWRARELQTSVEIRESEERYRALVEQAPMPILVNREDRVVLANQACLRLFGTSAPDQLLGKSLFDLFHPDCHPEISEQLHRLRDEGEEIPQIDQRIVRLDGSTVDVEVAAAPFRDQGVDSVHVVLNDITKRKRAEEAVHEASRYSRNLLETSLDPLVTISSTGKITDVNTATERITGKSREGLIDSDFADYFTDPEAARAVYLKAFSAGQVIDYPLDIRHSSGAITEVLYNASVYRDEQGKVLGVFAAARDVTERNRAQGEIRRLNAELEQRVLDRTAQLDAANEELEAFAYSVSHDLRAPLRHISGFSGLLAERTGDGLDEKSRHYVETISRSVREMGVLIDDLLEFSRTGRTELTIEPVDMDATLAEALEPLRRETGDRDIEWSIRPLPAVVGDHALLRQVWANLLGNAVKYTRGRTPAVIEVGARDGADEDVFYVLDNGAGFDMQYAHKLFGVFQRLHSSAEFEGTGIGLANVQRIINRLGGRVWAEAELDHGATFTFALPRRKETPS